MQKFESRVRNQKIVTKDKIEQTVKRGDIFLIKGEGIDCFKRYVVPALVLQNDQGNKFSPTTIVALATLERELHKGKIMFDFSNISTIDKRRIIKKIGTISYEKMLGINKNVLNSVIVKVEMPIPIAM